MACFLDVFCDNVLDWIRDNQDATFSAVITEVQSQLNASCIPFDFRDPDRGSSIVASSWNADTNKETLHATFVQTSGTNDMAILDIQWLTKKVSCAVGKSSSVALQSKGKNIVNPGGINDIQIHFRPGTSHSVNHGGQINRFNDANSENLKGKNRSAEIWANNNNSYVEGYYEDCQDKSSNNSGFNAIWIIIVIIIIIIIIAFLIWAFNGNSQQTNMTRRPF